MTARCGRRRFVAVRPVVLFGRSYLCPDVRAAHHDAHDRSPNSRIAFDQPEYRRYQILFTQILHRRIVVGRQPCSAPIVPPAQVRCFHGVRLLDTALMWSGIGSRMGRFRGRLDWLGLGVAGSARGPRPTNIGGSPWGPKIAVGWSTPAMALRRSSAYPEGRMPGDVVASQGDATGNGEINRFRGYRKLRPQPRSRCVRVSGPHACLIASRRYFDGLIVDSCAETAKLLPRSTDRVRQGGADHSMSVLHMSCTEIARESHSSNLRRMFPFRPWSDRT